MESAYTLASRALAQIREENRAELHRRIQQIRTLNPDYDRIEAALARNGSSLARCVLEGKQDISTIETNIRSLRKERATLLQKAGLPEDYLEDIYTCPDCRDTGFDQTGSRCHCLKRLAAAFTGAAANLTEHMKEQTFDRFDYSLFANQPPENGREPLVHIKRAFKLGLQFAETFDTTHANLLLTGNAGTGKTFLSGCIANHALARKKTVYYQTAFTLFDMLEKLKFGRLSGEELENAEAVARYIYDVDLLIIDDLGTEFVSNYSAAVLFDLINSRQLHQKSTILSTNINNQGLEQIYSRRLLSRILGSYDVIPFIGQDLRMKKFRTQSL